MINHNVNAHPLSTLHPRLLEKLGDKAVDMRGRTLINLSDLLKWFESPAAVWPVLDNGDDRFRAFEKSHGGLVPESTTKYLRLLCNIGILSADKVRKDNNRTCYLYTLIK